MIILFLFLISSAAMTYSLYLVNSTMYLLPAWIVASLIASTLLLLFIVYCILVPIFNKLSPANKFKHAVLRQILQILCLFSRTSYKVENKERLINDPKVPLVIVGNHKSLLDPVWTHLMYSRSISAAAKSTLNKICLFRPLANAFQVLSINRDSDREAAKAIIQGAKNAQDGLAYIIYPEGGIKTRENEQMVSLRPGAYKLATRAKATIQIVATHNATKCSTRRTLFSWTTVTIKVLEPISYEDYKDMSTTELGLEIAKRVNETFDGPQVTVEVL